MNHLVKSVFGLHSFVLSVNVPQWFKSLFHSSDLSAAVISPKRWVTTRWVLWAAWIDWTEPSPEEAALPLLPWRRTQFNRESLSSYGKARVMPKLSLLSFVALIGLVVVLGNAGWCWRWLLWKPLLTKLEPYAKGFLLPRQLQGCVCCDGHHK